MYYVGTLPVLVCGEKKHHLGALKFLLCLPPKVNTIVSPSLFNNVMATSANPIPCPFPF